MKVSAPHVFDPQLLKHSAVCKASDTLVAP